MSFVFIKNKEQHMNRSTTQHRMKHVKHKFVLFLLNFKYNTFYVKQNLEIFMGKIVCNENRNNADVAQTMLCNKVEELCKI